MTRKYPTQVFALALATAILAAPAGRAERTGRDAVDEALEQPAGPERLRAQLLDITYALYEFSNLDDARIGRTIAAIEELRPEQLTRFADAGVSFTRLHRAVNRLQAHLHDRRGGGRHEAATRDADEPYEPVAESTGLPDAPYSTECGDLRSAVADTATLQLALDALQAARVAARDTHRVCEQVDVLAGDGGNDMSACMAVDDTLSAEQEVFEDLVLCLRDIDSAEIQGAYDRLGHLHDDVEIVQSSIDGVETDVTDIQTKVDAFDVDLTTIEAKVDDIQSTVDDLDINVDTIVITQLDPDEPGSTADLVEVIDDEVTQVDNKVVTLDGKVVGLDGKVVTLDGKVVGLDGKVVTLDGKVVNLDGKVITLDGKVITLDGKVVTLDGKVVALDGKVVALDAKVDSLGTIVTDVIEPTVAKTAADVVVVESKIDNLTLRVNLVELLPLEEALAEGVVLPVMALREANGGQYETVEQLVDLRLTQYERVGHDVAQALRERDKAADAVAAGDLVKAVRHLSKAMRRLVGESEDDEEDEDD